MASAERPYVICHMAPSIDGRIVTAPWPSVSTLYSTYERTAGTFKADAWIVGRISMAPYAGKTSVAKSRAKRTGKRKDFIAASASSYAVAIDPSGKLAWQSSEIDGAHVISIISGRVSDDYLAFLQSKGVSYLIGGATRIDLRRVLRKLRAAFGIKRLLLEGGGTINGSFLRAGVIDELSLLIVPIADGSVGTPTLFDAGTGKGPSRRFRLRSIKRLAGDVVWLRYKA